MEPQRARCGIFELTLPPSQRLTVLRIHTVWAMGDEPAGYAARPESAVTGNYGKADWNCKPPSLPENPGRRSRKHRDRDAPSLSISIMVQPW